MHVHGLFIVLGGSESLQADFEGFNARGFVHIKTLHFNGLLFDKNRLSGRMLITIRFYDCFMASAHFLHQRGLAMRLNYRHHVVAFLLTSRLCRFLVWSELYRRAFLFVLLIVVEDRAFHVADYGLVCLVVRRVIQICLGAGHRVVVAEEIREITLLV